jgi:hypothetical protein
LKLDRKTKTRPISCLSFLVAVCSPDGFGLADAQFIGDGFCDDEFNTPECNYDGQDCCLGNKQFCQDCKCTKVYNHTEYTIEHHCEYPQYFGDNVCDDPNNSPGCYFDGGDCCKPEADRSWCTDCICYEEKAETSNISCPLSTNASKIGDGFCDSELNIAECNYDKGDCCLLDLEGHNCQDCICKMPWEADNCKF